MDEAVAGPPPEVAVRGRLDHQLAGRALLDAYRRVQPAAPGPVQRLARRYEVVSHDRHGNQPPPGPRFAAMIDRRCSSGMGDRWYPKAVVYCLDVDTFADSDGDGVGDLRGLIGRLDYLARLGVTCLWLHPIHPTPGPRRRLRRRPTSTTSTRASAPSATSPSCCTRREQPRHQGDHRPGGEPHLRRAPVVPVGPLRRRTRRTATGTSGPTTEPADRHQGMVFPGEQDETWSYDRTAKAWYYHRFYKFQPDLNFANPAGPRGDQEDLRVLAPARRRRVPDGRGAVHHRADRAGQPGLARRTSSSSPSCASTCSGGRATRSCWPRPTSSRTSSPTFFGDAGGSANRIHMLFDFMLNGRLMLALARRGPGADHRRAARHPEAAGRRAVGHVPAQPRRDRPVPAHHRAAQPRCSPSSARTRTCGSTTGASGAGSPRCSATTGGASSWRTRCSSRLRGTPVLRYGEEIGMGEDLSLPGRDAIRTPMQWSVPAQRRLLHRARPEKLVRPVITGGEFGYEKVNVTAQRHDPKSLLAWFERMIRTLREAPEVGCGTLHPRRRAGAARGAGAPRRRRHRHDGVPAQPRHRRRRGRPEQRSPPRPSCPTTCSPTRSTAGAGQAGRARGGRLRLPLDPAAPTRARPVEPGLSSADRSQITGRSHDGVRSHRVAIVTGAARGIGAATARRLAADGMAVAVVDLDEAACARHGGRDRRRGRPRARRSAPTSPTAAAGRRRRWSGSPPSWARRPCWSTTPACSATTCCSR